MAIGVPSVPPITGEDTRAVVESRFRLSGDYASDAYAQASALLQQLLALDLIDMDLADVVLQRVGAPPSINPVAPVRPEIEDITVPDTAADITFQRETTPATPTPVAPTRPTLVEPDTDFDLSGVAFERQGGVPSVNPVAPVRPALADVDSTVDTSGIAFEKQSEVPGITPVEPSRPTLDTVELGDIDVDGVELERVGSTPSINPVAPVRPTLATVDSVEADITFERAADPPAVNPVEPVRPALTDIETSEIDTTVTLDRLGSVPEINPAAPVRPTLEDITVSAELEAVEFEPMSGEYTSELTRAVIAKLLNWVLNGGTGLGSAIEAEIWQNARARQELESEKTRADITERFSVQGWHHPPGAYFGQYAEANARIERNLTILNSEIAIEQARLAQTNTHFAVEKAIQIEKNLMDYFLDLTRNAVAIFQGKIERLKALIMRDTAIADIKSKKNDGLVKLYEADAQVYAQQWDALTKVFTVLARENETAANIALERIKVILQRDTAFAEIRSKKNENLIRLYEADSGAYSQAWNALTAIFSEQVKQNVAASEALYRRVQAEIQAAELSIKANDGLIRIYEADASVYAQQWNALTQIFSELVKENIAAAELAMERIKVTIQRDTAFAEIRSKKNENLIRLYEADAGMYSQAWNALTQIFSEKVKENVAQADVLFKRVQAEIQAAELTLKANDGLIRIYEADAQVYAQQWNALTQIFSELVKENIAAADVAVKRLQAEVQAAELKLKNNEGLIRIYEADSTVYAQTWNALTQIFSELVKQNVSEAQIMMERIKTLITRDTAIAEIQSKKNEGLVKLYEADAQVYASMWDALVKVFAELVKENVAEAELLIKRAQTLLEEKVQAYGFNKEAMKQAAMVAAQMMASALGSVSAGMSIGFHEQRSDSTSQTGTGAETESIGVSTSHIYHHND